MDERGRALYPGGEGWPPAPRAADRDRAAGLERDRARARADHPTRRRPGQVGSSDAWSDDPWRGEALDPARQDQDALSYALGRLRAQAAALALVFEVPGVLLARRERQLVLDRLDGYVLPRISDPDAPLLVVVGGSTGAGKSTLTNSLIGVEVSRSGFLRPTTRHPVLVYNPDDSAAFLSHRILPGLVRTTVTGYSLDGGGMPPPGTPSIQLVPHPAIPRGLAIVDSPDLDSVAAGNRELAKQLFRAADLWIFVTSGTDYADAVPWDLLVEAVQRRIGVAVVLDRMRPSEIEPVRMHFATMLIEHGLASAPVFTLPDTMLQDGLLPARLIAPLQGWLDLQASEAVRGAHVERAVDGTLAQVLDRVELLAEAADDQAAAERRLRLDLEALFGRGRDLVAARAVDGTAVDEQVRAAWRQLGDAHGPSAGEWLRRRVTAALRGNARYGEASTALRGSLTSMITAYATEAFGLVLEHWSNHPGAMERLYLDAGMFELGPDFSFRADESLVGWQVGTLELVRPGQSRYVAVAGEDPQVLALTTLAVGPAGETTAAAQTLIESGGTVPVPLREAVRLVREDLVRRLSALLDEQADRLRARLDGAAADPRRAAALRAAAATVRELLPLA